jgi:hypothetical protein
MTLIVADASMTSELLWSAEILCVVTQSGSYVMRMKTVSKAKTDTNIS